MGGVCSEAIESQNVVGYMTSATESDNNFVTAPFVSVGYVTTDIQDIKISDGGAGTIGYGTENFSVWEGVPTVVAGSEFVYWDPLMDLTGEATDYFWGDSSFNKAQFSIAPGQSVVINCGSGLEMTVAGQVSSEKLVFTSKADNNFMGNPYAAAIDIQDIKISDGGAGTIGYGTENFSVWEGVPTVTSGSEFVYWDPLMDLSGKATDYFWGDSSFNKAVYPIAPGKGVVVNCTEGLTISVEVPYAL